MRRSRQALERAIGAADRPGQKAQAHYELAVFHDNRGREKAAIPHYEQALSLGLEIETRAECLAWLASSLFKTGRHDEALSRLDQSMSIAPPDLAAWLAGLSRRITRAIASGSNQD